MKPEDRASNEPSRHLAALVAAAAPPDLPGLIGCLEEARARAWARLTTEAARPREVKLLSVDEAAELARIPRRRLWSLARSAPWAVRVGRRLLVDDSLFRKWLDTRADVRRGRETT